MSQSIDLVGARRIGQGVKKDMQDLEMASCLIRQLVLRVGNTLLALNRGKMLLIEILGKRLKWVRHCTRDLHSVTRER